MDSGTEKQDNNNEIRISHHQRY